jgi:cytochrome P450
VVLVPKSTIGEAYGYFIPLSLDPPAHTPVRRVLNDKLLGSKVNHWESGIRNLAIELIEAFRSNRRCDFVREFADKLPLQVFMQLVDLPLADLPRLKHLADQFTRPDGSIESGDVRKAFHDYLAPIMAERKGSGRADVLTHIADSSVGGQPIRDIDATNLASQVMVGGLDTVVNFLSFMMMLLATRPDLQRQIAENPASMTHVTNELLRRLPIVSSAREVVADVEVDGVTLRSGDMVVAPTALFGLSEEINKNPLEVDFGRSNKQHATFGFGHHSCPGHSLARMEIRIVLEEWFARIPSFRLAPNQRVGHRGGITAGTDPFILEWD